MMSEAGLSAVEVSSRDNSLWARQRAGQRSSDQALVRVSARPSQLPALLALADRCEATAVGRAGVGISYLELDPSRVLDLRQGLPAGAWAELLDRPSAAVSDPDPWGAGNGPQLRVDACGQDAL